MIDNHIAGTRLGSRRLSAVRTPEVQAWVTGAFANPFSWHRAACSTNAALGLQCRSPRSTSGREPGDPLEHAEVREAKDHAVVRTRGSRPSRRRGPWSSPNRPRSASRRVTGAPRTGCRLSPAYGAGRIPDTPGRQVPSTAQDTKITTRAAFIGSGRQGTRGGAHR
jgi:hypothetical protein